MMLESFAELLKNSGQINQTLNVQVLSESAGV
ncbi:hypothetical protein EV695_1096 [Cocleimonas flava]|uniref:Uncharacterized protein n=1 Tax=Cocleimonas flava TaxID=634765 RepID=A0A4R1F911_9GAMM|nr:hypothetical protein EV695_1096 [Cocleimonas flava]